jgi:hypothetical protein
MDQGVNSLPIGQFRADNLASRRKLLLFLLLHPPIFPSYILARLREYGLSNQWPDLPFDNWRRKAWRVVVWMENVARVWELGGWGMLLWDGRSVPAGSRTEEGADGRYPSLLMRALGLRLVPSSPHLAKLVSYEYMNRQLVWNAFTVSPSLTRFVALADEIGIRNVRFPPTTTLTILFPTFSPPRTHSINPKSTTDHRLFLNSPVTHS